ncbi:MAG: Ribosomal protein methylthiotransferase RimO [Parachlamydiales bacterium]|nr:Ribosomal protein methylthiotransferase RimO [Parachlamydiales bacterium]
MAKNSVFQNKFHFTSLGCPRNRVDSEVMIGLLLKAGYDSTSRLNDADFIIVNTCSFLEASRVEGFDTIAQIFQEKKKDAKVIVAGCMVQKCKDDLRVRFPGIHFLVGSGDVEKILDAIQSVQAGEAVTSAKSFLEWGEIPRTLSTPRHYGYLKIAEGCSKRCAFCIIPSIKGLLRSKSVEQVLKEFRSLLDRGVYEIILIAQDLGDFGKDRQEKGALAALLKTMLQEPRDFWLRLLYLYPDEIDDELIQIMKSDRRICPYLDMPIQHINDEMLQTMHRKTSRSQIVNTIAKLRQEIPDISIRTSLLVGFPNESEEQFQELLDFVKEVKLEQVGIFKFSLEKEAYASRLDNQIAEEIKQTRFEKIAAAQQKIVKKKNRSYIGRRLVAMIDGYHPDSEFLLAARHWGQCPEIDGLIIINDAPKNTVIGQLHTVEITDVAGYDLIGRVVDVAGGKRCKLALY